jgi:hypothetical protein
MMNEKLKIIQSFINKKVIYYMPLPTGGVQRQDLILHAAWINKDMVLVDFNEYPKYIVNADTVGIIHNDKIVSLYTEIK